MALSNFIAPAVAGLIALGLIASLIFKPLKGVRNALSGWAGKYSLLFMFGVIALLLVSAGGGVWLQQKASDIQTGKIGTAAVFSQPVVTEKAITDIDCVFAVPTTVITGGSNAGLTYQADSKANNKYTALVLHNNGTSAINGTLSCTRKGDIEKAGTVDCWIKGDSFRNEVSTSDTSTYYIIALNSSVSKVGLPWAQYAFLNDGSVATSSSDREKTSLVFVGGSSAQAKETLGYLFQLPGLTVFQYLNNQTSQDVHFYCNPNGVEKEVATFTVTKVSA